MKQIKYKENLENSRNNVIIFMAIVVVAIIVLLGRYAQLALVKKVNQVDLTQLNQSVPNRSSIELARRGNLYDHKGQPIAMDTTSYSIYAVLKGDWAEGKIVKDYEKTAQVLSNYLDLSPEEILAYLQTPNVDQVEFGSAGAKLSPQTKEAIENQDLSGIGFHSETSRMYINDFYASHLIGYVKKVQEMDPHQVIFKGESGIEAAYDEWLSGENQMGPNNYPVGQDIYLTLDHRLQNGLEDILQDIYRRYQPKQVGAYLVEVKSGKLLAAGQRPSFNLNTKEGIDDLWQNLMVEAAYEPGSTIKILTMAEAIDQGVIKENDGFKSGSVEVYNYTVRDYNKYGWGWLNFDEGLIRSSNVGMVELVKRMGDDNWVTSLRKMGFGTTTASRLPNETTGNLDFSNPVSRIMSGFGQGFSATPIQLMQAFTSIANQGEMVKIQYIEHVANQSYKRQVLGQAFSHEAANHVLKIMEEAVSSKHGTGQAFKRSDLRVAAKTGTAEIADPNSQGYLQGKNDYYFSVVSFFPAESPQYMVYIFVKQPQQMAGKSGTQIVSEVFHPLVDAVMINH